MHIGLVLNYRLRLWISVETSAHFYWKLSVYCKLSLCLACPFLVSFIKHIFDFQFCISARKWNFFGSATVLCVGGIVLWACVSVWMSVHVYFLCVSECVCVYFLCVSECIYVFYQNSALLIFCNLGEKKVHKDHRSPAL